MGCSNVCRPVDLSLRSVFQVSKLACLEGGAVAKGEMKVAFMVVLMVLTFLISWMPYAGLAMLVVYNPDVQIHPLVGTVPVYLAKSSTVYNPLIYIYLNKQVVLSHHMHTIIELMRCDEEENTSRQHHLVVWIDRVPCLRMLGVELW